MPVRSQDSVASHFTKKRLSLGGYGEVLGQHNFYSDNVQRYLYPENHSDEQHSRFDLPHVTFYVAYELGNGWRMSSEIEFEHGGSGSTYEIEKEETGEYETEIEKGGEVNLEQFWLEKTFSPAFNIRAGHIIVPVGLTNQYHLPTEYLTAQRPEEETSILPSAWHQTGISLWGRTKRWRYEVQALAGLDAERFNNANWIKYGSASPYEFEIANALAGAVRIDNYSLPGLRIGLSGYLGNSALNSLKWERYKNRGAKGTVAIVSVDKEYKRNNVWCRGNVLYGHLSDSYLLSTINKNMPSGSPAKRTDIASGVFSGMYEAAYDILSIFKENKNRPEKLYLFAHYGYYNSMFQTDDRVSAKEWCAKHIAGIGLNYYPLKELVIKAEYMHRFYASQYNNEPSLSVCIAYSGMFKY